MPATAQELKVNNHELSVDIFIDAAPETVWAVMTGQFEQWWCPRPWLTEVIALDWRAGGRSAMVMRGPDEGEEHALEGIFLEVTPGVRFVTTNAINHKMEPQIPFMIGCWELSPEGAGTRYRASSRHWTEEARAEHEQMGFFDGWNACARQLKELVENQ